jgi:hypothetical protein
MAFPRTSVLLPDPSAYLGEVATGSLAALRPSQRADKDMRRQMT